MFSPEALLERLTDPLRLLTGGARDQPVRLRTMRDAVAWSYDLLSPQEQTLFRQVAVFHGGCTLEAAEAVCSGPDRDVLEGMSALVDQSLLHRLEEAGAVPRFGMLETVRVFALEQLAASAEEAVVRDAHATYILDLAERARPWGAPLGLERLEAQHDNVRAALAWLLKGGRPGRGGTARGEAAALLVVAWPFQRGTAVAGTGAGRDQGHLAADARACSLRGGGVGGPARRPR